jgi:DNA-binding MarR family transcriptional regulator
MSTYSKDNDEIELGTFLCHCLVTRRMSRFVSKIDKDELAPACITENDVAIFDRLSAKTKMTMSELADGMLMERATLVSTVRPLQDKGFIETSKVPGSRREPYLSLTDAGREKKAEGERLCSTTQGEREDRPGKYEAGQLCALLLKTMGDPQAEDRVQVAE